MRSISFEVEAEGELSAAVSFYEAQVEGLGADFLAVLDHELARIQTSPLSFALDPRTPASVEARRCVLPRFPFSVVFIDRAEGLRILAVAHQSRRPGYWRKRLGGRRSH